MLLLTWILFYPGLILEGPTTVPVQCRLSSGMSGTEGVCTIDDINEKVALIETKTKEIVGFAASKHQVETAISYRKQMDSDVSKYVCDDLKYVDDVKVLFPDWCAERQQQEINKRRKCCTDYKYKVPNVCKRFAYGKVVACTKDFSNYPKNGVQEVSGKTQTGCHGYKTPCPKNVNAGLDSEQRVLAA